MNKNEEWLDGTAWGLGGVAIMAIAYCGTWPNRSPQAIAFASHAMFIEIMTTRPEEERLQNVIYPDPTFTSFVVVGWVEPLATIQMPKVDRSN